MHIWTWVNWTKYCTEKLCQRKCTIASVQWSHASRVWQPTVSKVASLLSSWAFDHQLGSSSYKHNKTRREWANWDWNHPDVKTKWKVSFSKLCAKWLLHRSTIIQQVAFRKRHGDDKCPQFQKSIQNQPLVFRWRAS
jgi:hypothetical protein